MKLTIIVFLFLSFLFLQAEPVAETVLKFKNNCSYAQDKIGILDCYVLYGFQKEKVGGVSQKIPYLDFTFDADYCDTRKKEGEYYFTLKIKDPKGNCFKRIDTKFEAKKRDIPQITLPMIYLNTFPLTSGNYIISVRTGDSNGNLVFAASCYMSATLDPTDINMVWDSFPPIPSTDSDYWDNSTLTPQPGECSLGFTLKPDDAVETGAKWSIDNGNTWLESNKEILVQHDTNIQVTFKSIPNYQTPSNTSVSIGNSSSYKSEVTYTLIEEETPPIEDPDQEDPIEDTEETPIQEDPHEDTQENPIQEDPEDPPTSDNGHQKLIDNLIFSGDPKDCTVTILLKPGETSFYAGINTNSSASVYVSDVDDLILTLQQKYKNVIVEYVPYDTYSFLNIYISENPALWEEIYTDTRLRLGTLAQYLSGQCNLENPDDRQTCLEMQWVFIGTAAILAIPTGGASFVYLGTMGLLGNTFLLVSDVGEGLVNGFDEELHSRIAADLGYTVLSLVDVAGGELIGVAKSSSIKFVTKYPKISAISKVVDNAATNLSLRLKIVGSEITEIFSETLLKSTKLTDNAIIAYRKIGANTLGNATSDVWKTSVKYKNIFGEIQMTEHKQFIMSIDEFNEAARTLANLNFNFGSLNNNIKGNILEEVTSNRIISAKNVKKFFKTGHAGEGLETPDIMYKRLHNTEGEVIGIMESKSYPSGGGVRDSVEQLIGRFESLKKKNFQKFIDAEPSKYGGPNPFTVSELQEAFYSGKMEFTVDVFDGVNSWISVIPFEDMNKLWNTKNSAKEVANEIMKRISDGMYSPSSTTEINLFKLDAELIEKIDDLYNSYTETIDKSLTN